VALTASGSHQSLAAIWITEHYFENHYKTFFDKSKAYSRRLALTLHSVPKLALRAQTVEVADLPLRQDL